MPLTSIIVHGIAATIALAGAAGATAVPAVSSTATPGADGRTPDVGSHHENTSGLVTACDPFREVPPRAQSRTVDGFRLGWLPPGLGPTVSDFEYEWGGVAFTTRVWESGSDHSGWDVDMQVSVLRGDRLHDAAGMHAFLAEYHERDPETWARTEFDHRGRPGFRTDSEVFWLARPGVVVSVDLDRYRFPEPAVARTACGVSEASGAQVG
ncbi:hypothetical protein CLV30_10441 [Haloactinopolyspora alba]|uniref:Uncharacterized protein n=1 Tax=Haloactinopolyspora alba TaxID=648780 RepID=A0A2P8E6W7_9ACTN|nr:hypothetical protein [Haloactinopolyspora alba]PSL05178.1 hypothetical protein CLV30_10441 [Haloactinopolyspora alba]